MFEEEGRKKKKAKPFSTNSERRPRAPSVPSLLSPAQMTASIAAGCARRSSVADRNAIRAPVNGATSSLCQRLPSPPPIRRPSSSSSSPSAVRATKTIASKPSSSAQALEKIGTQLLNFAGKDKKKNRSGGSDTIIIPAGAESQIARRIVFSLLRAGKSVVAGTPTIAIALGILDRNARA